MVHRLFGPQAFHQPPRIARDSLDALPSQLAFIGRILKERCWPGEPYLLACGRVFWRRSGYLPADSAIFRLPSHIDMVCRKELRQYAGSGMELSSIYTRENRRRFLVAAAILIVVIATVDWLTKPFISIGFLYLFPIMLIAGFLARWQTVVVALVCAILQELFSELPSGEAVTRLLMASAGFVGTGLFVSEMIRSRQAALEHLEAVETHSKLRQDAEEQLRIMVESSPAAIVTIDSSGRVLLANNAAQTLFASEDTAIVGQSIAQFLPALQSAAETQRSTQFRTELRCRGRRKNGEAFLGAVWFSTYNTSQGPRLAAIIVDLSEDLRDREDLSLDHLLKSTKILMGAVAHEIRNVCGAVLAVHKNLSRLPALQDNEDFRALGLLIDGLEKLSEMELLPPLDQTLSSVELTTLLDELRVLIEPSYQETATTVAWRLQDNLPLVIGDRYGLQQVFLNLARNSQHAMESTEQKQLTISSELEPNAVVIRFEDTGVGIPSPYQLFKPFQQGANATGLGLYVSRAILRSFGAELRFEPRTTGCCFAVRLARVLARKETSNG
jgi:two-component system, LuxR family, sensor kinase FixL